MKKIGFTLAEVLITLAIIGVVASMTLPSLMTNVGEQQYRAGIKKGVNTLTEAAKLNDGDEGWDYGFIVADSNVNQLSAANRAATEARSLMSLLNNRTSIDYKTTGTNANTGLITGTTAYDGFAVVLQDGSSILFPATAGNSNAARILLQDGLPTGFVVLYDTNGAKGPNFLSNCLGNPVLTPTFTENGADTATLTDCNDRTKRIIRDQFMLKLRGQMVEPAGGAAEWALNN